jgi:two-component system, LytTR family, sensor kinase
LPPLTTQALIEDAIKYNIVSSEQPLTIRISVDGQNRLVFTNNLQLRNQVLPFSEADCGLGNIRRRFEFFTHELVDVEQTRSEFIVRLPLIQ